MTQSVAYILRTSNPAAAYALALGDGRVTAERARAIASSPDASPEDRRYANGLAMRALRQDPTVGGAADALALNRRLRGDALRAQLLFDYAQRLSRRDLQVQLWAIEDAAKRGNVTGALAHFDIALRTSSKAPDLLFPVLAAAISDPIVCRDLAKTLSAAPAWGGAFIKFVSARGGDPRSTLKLFLALHDSAVVLPSEANVAVINSLLAAGFTDDAWHYYAVIRKGSDRHRSRDPRFTAALDIPSTLDWTLFADGNSGSLLERIDGGGIEFSTPPNVGAQLLRQLQLLTPGEYLLVGRSSGIDQAASSLPYWTLTCQKDGQELGRVEISNSSSTGGEFRGTFRVPAGCVVQALVLTARPSTTSTGLSGRILRVQLVPMR